MIYFWVFWAFWSLSKLFFTFAEFIIILSCPLFLPCWSLQFCISDRALIESDMYTYKYLQFRGLSLFRPVRFMSTRFMSPDSCPSDSCPTLFMSDPFHVHQDRFMSGPIHVLTDSCPTLFMSDPFHVHQDPFMSGPVHVRPHSCPRVPIHVWPYSCQAPFLPDEDT